MLSFVDAFYISSWFNVTVTAYLKHLLSFLLMGFVVAFSFFIQSTESIYDPPRFGCILWYLWYSKWTWLETNWLPLILNYFEIYFLVNQKVLITSSASSLIMISILSISESITCSASLSMEEINLFAIVNWIFHVPDFLRLFVMPFKCRLILLRCSSADTFLFLSALPSYSI